MNRLVPNEHMQKVCKIGQGKECCRYLTVSMVGFECEKGGELAAILDKRVAQNEMVAQGDNCEGIFSIEGQI